YMSPEQARSDDLDETTDLWALGVVFMEMLSGKKIFSAATVSETLVNVLRKEPDWGLLPPELPPGVLGLLKACLAKDRSRRPRSAGEVRRALEILSASMAGPTAERPGLSIAGLLDPTPAPASQPSGQVSQPPVSVDLPRYLTSFVGREKELDALVAACRDQRLVTVAGMPGSGKTRLAVRVAERLHEGGGPSACFVDLATVSEPGLVAARVGMALGLREAPGQSMERVILDALPGRGQVLVLDGCEHLLTACRPLVETILRECPEQKLLITTLEPLALPGEVVHSLPPLATPSESATRLDDFLASPSVQLFVDRARSIHPGFQVDASDVEPLREICTMLDGLPLALELAASRTRALSLRDLAGRLRGGLRLLKSKGQGTAVRQQTLEVALDWSHDLLEPEEQLLYRRLSIFAGGWTLEAAEETCSDDQLDDIDVLDALSRLVDKSVVTVEREGGEARYRLLRPTRQHARTRLERAGEVETFRERHRQHYTEMASRTIPHGPGAPSAWRRNLAELDNFREALGSDEHPADPAAVLELLVGLTLTWQRFGLTREGRERLEAALGRAGESVEPRLRGRALLCLAQLAGHQGDHAGCRSALHRGLDLVDAKEDQRLLATANGWLAVTHARMGDLSTAHALAEEQLARSRPSGDVAQLLASLNILGNLRLEAADANSASQAYQEALGLARQIGDDEAVAGQLNNLGLIALETGDIETARSLFTQALELNKALHKIPEQANNHLNLGLLAAVAGDAIATRQECRRALVLLQRLGSLPMACVARLILAGSHARGDEVVAAGELVGVLKVVKRLPVGLVATALESVARLTSRRSGWSLAGRLLGAAAALRSSASSPADGLEGRWIEETTTSCREGLGEEELEEALRAGRALEVDSAIRLAQQALAEMVPGDDASIAPGT
ncbi:MAG: AAA family ATPase, partial [Acidobacteriota bacterium]